MAELKDVFSSKVCLKADFKVSHFAAHGQLFPWVCASYAYLEIFLCFLDQTSMLWMITSVYMLVWLLTSCELVEAIGKESLELINLPQKMSLMKLIWPSLLQYLSRSVQGMVTQYFKSSYPKHDCVEISSELREETLWFGDVYIFDRLYRQAFWNKTWNYHQNTYLLLRH